MTTCGMRARQHGDDERRERGHQRHGHQVRQALVQIHDGRLIELARIVTPHYCAS